MKSINVLVLTYNQESVISRCLDTILSQKDFGLNKIIVSDDCSTDGTWSALLDYACKYPGIVEIHRNDSNLGIYPNTMRLISLRGDADLYYETAGDDAICEGWFKEVQSYIDCNQVDFSKPIGIYSDWKEINTKGVTHVFEQRAIETGLPLFSLCIRERICSRSLLINNAVINKYGPLIEGRGLNLEESAYDIMPHRIIENAYYLPIVGSIYYSGRGVSVALNKKGSSYHKEESIIKWQFFIDHYIDNKKDMHFARYKIECGKFAIRPSLRSFYYAMAHYHKSRVKELNNSFMDYWFAAIPLLGTIKRRFFF